MGISKDRRRISDRALRPLAVRVQAGVLANTDGTFTLSVMKAPTKSIVESASITSTVPLTGSLEGWVLSVYNTTQAVTIGSLTPTPTNDFVANTPKDFAITAANSIMEEDDVLDILAVKSAGTNTKLILAEITMQVNHRPV